MVVLGGGAGRFAGLFGIPARAQPAGAADIDRVRAALSRAFVAEPRRTRLIYRLGASTKALELLGMKPRL